MGRSDAEGTVSGGLAGCLLLTLLRTNSGSRCTSEERQNQTNGIAAKFAFEFSLTLMTLACCSHDFLLFH
jgi:hypothetical protein